MIVFWLINIALWLAFAWYNYYFLSKKVKIVKIFKYSKKINFHFWGAVVSTIVAFAFMFVALSDFTSIQLYSLPFICLTIRWVFFDITLNLLFNQKWWYYGNVTKNLRIQPYLKNGDMDVFFGWTQIPLKFVLFVVSLCISFF